MVAASCLVSQKEVDAVLVVSATPEQQQQRVLSRPGMSKEKLETILARQVGWCAGLGLSCGEFPGRICEYPSPRCSLSTFQLSLLQVPDADKRRQATFVIDTSGSLQDTEQQVEHILQLLLAQQHGAG
jgi:dephospho-CoA kinase